MKTLLISLLFLITLIACNGSDNSYHHVDDRKVDTNLLSTKVTKDNLETDSASLIKSEEFSEAKDTIVLSLDLKNCLKYCLSEVDSSKCITETAKRLNAKMNGTYLLILEGKEVLAYEEHLVALDEVQRAQHAWLKFKEQELYLICHIADNYETLDLDTTYPRYEVAADWCTDQSNMGMRRCAVKITKYSDSLINVRQISILQLLDEKGKEEFEETQIAWRLYKKSQARIHHKIMETFDGSMYPTSALYDKERIVRQRAIELEHYITFLSKD
ncbi:MAG: DUF1311 domain-containing protein [Crocinitomicaceae bacterium]|nr:lysozyme inhibitor LprI family protein [Flavobacteriales bacterium]NQZ38117.1 DUF1311 domain-containing protein [Crocinitomicaceae bacterium]